MFLTISRRIKKLEYINLMNQVALLGLQHKLFMAKMSDPTWLTSTEDQIYKDMDQISKDIDQLKVEVSFHLIIHIKV